MTRLGVLVLLLGWVSPVWADEVLLTVNQTHTLSWDWSSTGSDVTSFVFQCPDYVKEVTGDARMLTFGSLVDTPGTYTGCTLQAKNEQGLSAPVTIPAFTYAYSYTTLGRHLLELLGSLFTLGGLCTRAGRRLLLSFVRPTPTPVLALPAPLTVYQKESDYARRA